MVRVCAPVLILSIKDVNNDVVQLTDDGGSIVRRGELLIASGKCLEWT